MSKQQDTIKNIVHALDTNEGGARGLDKAIRQNTPFAGTQDAINHFIADRDRYRSADDFLRSACGIILDNEDTGALTGSDAGGSEVKTAASVVPNYSIDGTWNDRTGFDIDGTHAYFYAANFADNYYYYKNGKKYSEYPLGWRNYTKGTKIGDTASVLSYDLSHAVIGPALRLAEQTYGLSLKEAGSKTDTIMIGFSRLGQEFSSESTEADTSLRYYYRKNGGKNAMARIRLVYNLDFFYNPARGSDYIKYRSQGSDGRWSRYNKEYLDRITAHELTHALMQANIDNYGELPLWFVEGCAELTQGVDDKWTSDIRAAAQGSSSLSRVMSTAASAAHGTGSEPNEAYYGGYMFLRYLAQQGAGSSQAVQPQQPPAPQQPQNARNGSDLLKNPWTMQTAAGRASTLRGSDNEITILWGQGAQHDTLISGSAKDYYLLGQNDGGDTVRGFKHEKDAIWLYDAPWTAIMTESDPGTTSIQTGNAKLRLESSGTGDISLMPPSDIFADERITIGEHGSIDASRTSSALSPLLLIGSYREGEASTLKAGAGDAALWGGSSAADTLWGGNGKDIYWIGKGDGNDTAYATDSKDEIHVWSTARVSDILLMRIGNDTLYVNVDGAGANPGANGLTVRGWDAANGVSALTLADGSRYRIGADLSLTRQSR